MHVRLGRHSRCPSNSTLFASMKKTLPASVLDSPSAALEENGHAPRDLRERPLSGGEEGQVILDTMLAFRAGDFSVRLPASWSGMNGKIADAFNEVLNMAERRSEETLRVC